MKPEEQRIAIAEACGRIKRPDGFWYPEGSTVGSQGIPDYCNDLNAMHEAENSLQLWQHEQFRDQLAKQVAPHHIWAREYYHRLRPYVSATAAQRAEAFLKTLSLWNP